MKKSVLFIILISGLFSTQLMALPRDFVYLHQIAPSILQDIRYATANNFIGRPIKGYLAPHCILTRQAAKQLSLVQKELLQDGYSLKVYDCYRPAQAVNDFVSWSKNPNDTKMKQEYYPNVPKSQLFKQGYISSKSAHSRGSTVDLTVAKLPVKQQDLSQRPALAPCFTNDHKQIHDHVLNSEMDMGTGFDCLDRKSNDNDKTLSLTAMHNRELLRAAMVKHGFKPYYKEWWHYTLKHEPYPQRKFNFPVAPPTE